MVEKIASHIYVLERSAQRSVGQYGDRYQHSAHGRSACFLLVALRAFFADVLPDLEITQLPDNGWADNHSHEQRCQAGKRGPNVT